MTLTSTKDQRFVGNRFIEVKNGFWSLYSNHLFPLGKFFHLFNCPFLIRTMRRMRKYIPPRFAVRLTERMDVSPQQSLVHRKNPINVSYYVVNIILKQGVNVTVTTISRQHSPVLFLVPHIDQFEVLQELEFFLLFYFPQVIFTLFPVHFIS